MPDRCFSDFVFNILSQVFGCSNKNPLKKLLYPINSRVFDGVKEKIKKYNVDIDVMIEAKAKDDALFRLVRELKYKTNYKFIDETSFEI